MALSKSISAQSPAQRVEQHLAAQEGQARAQIASAEAKATTSLSRKLHAARLYKEATETRYAEVLKAYRGAQDREASISQPRRTTLGRLLGRGTDSKEIDTVRNQIAALHADLIAADRAALAAQSNLARVEKSEATDRMSQLSKIEVERRSAMGTLAEIAMARGLVQAFPTIVYCGSDFVAWAGSKVQRKRGRYGLRNPQAKNIWGLPLDFG